MTAITGYIQNLIGAYYPDLVLVAEATNPYYQPLTGGGVALIPYGTTAFASASGYISMNLPETESTGQLVAFSGKYTADGVYEQIFFVPVIIPDVASIDFSDLLVVVQADNPFFLPSNSGGGGIVAGVTSVSLFGGSAQTGSITFTAGQNVHITQTGKNFTFSASGGGVGSDVNIFDSNGNALNSTDGNLDVYGIQPWATFDQATPKQIPVTDISTPLLAENPNRLYASFTNNDAQAQTIYLQYGIDAQLRAGYPVTCGGRHVINLEELFTGAVFGIAPIGKTITISVIEGIE